MIDERKLTRYIKTEINPYGKPFNGTVYEFGNMLMDYIERMEKEPEIVHCKDCKLHNSCSTEDVFNFFRLENGFCAVGKVRNRNDI